MHGVKEVEQAVRELCIHKYQPLKYWDFVVNVNQKCSIENIDNCWITVSNSLDIDTKKINECSKNEGINILEKQVEFTKDVRSSPTLIINNTVYNGKRTSNDFKNFICSGFENIPESCKVKLNSDVDIKSTGNC